MPRYTIVPEQNSHAAFFLDGTDGGALLNALSNKLVREADIWEAEAYLYSVRRSPKAGFWEIFQRRGLTDSGITALG